MPRSGCSALHGVNPISFKKKDLPGGYYLKIIDFIRKTLKYRTLVT